MSTVTSVSQRPDAYRHEALFYSNDVEFLQGTEPFIREAIHAGERLLVAVVKRHTDLLKDALGDDAEHVAFVNMEELGRNPARIIPAWRDFVNKEARYGRTVRGIGEPIWAARTADELLECQLHEQLLNVAFDPDPAWWLLCPYDTHGLPPEVIAEARRSHPFAYSNGEHAECRDYDPLGSRHAFESSLNTPLALPESIAFRDSDLAFLRDLIVDHDACAGLSTPRRAELALAVNELVTNAIRHGGGKGTLHIWQSGNTTVCEVQSSGRIREPMVGRKHPGIHRDGGRGLWIVNQLCDLVQIRSNAAGTTVRLHMMQDA